jgi:hypothetical protein
MSGWLNSRENEQLSKYGDTKSARSIMLLELKKLIEANPLFREKLAFPVLKASRLRTLINQRYFRVKSVHYCRFLSLEFEKFLNSDDSQYSLNWQHQLCKTPRSNPDIKTLFVDHTCGPQNGSRPIPPVNSPLVGNLPKGGAFPLTNGVSKLTAQLVCWKWLV